jgi:hypothetical protein
MTELFQSLAQFQGRLMTAGIDSAVIGGIAVSVWARPRTTLDVDLKILLHRDQAQRLIDLLPPDYMPLQDDPLHALQRHGVLFIKDRSGIRIDVQLADVRFDEVAIQRACAIELESGVMAQVCSAEDLIIYKIISTRPQDHVDVENIIRRQGDALDDRYVLKWLRLFEQALDDSTLILSYQRFRQKYSGE